MCGIAGWIGEDSDAKEMSQRMAQRLRHGGPDGQGKAYSPEHQTEALVRALEGLPPEKPFVPDAPPLAPSLYDEIDGLKGSN